MRLIDADALLEKMKRTYRYFDIKFDVEEAPTIDAVPVVRCKNCKQFLEYTREYAQTVDGADGDCYIRLMNDGEKQYAACNYDDFCSYGERNEDDN